MLAEERKLSLDDPVSRIVPALTRANEVTIRQLLSHSSGYQDYWPQDYVPPFMLREITAGAILDRWAKMPLDFDPGTQYQYSNTNYVIAGLIIEKASGTPFLEFLRARIFVPLGMMTRYGLGVGVTTESGHRVLEHGGEVSGFTAENAVFPDDRAAISVLTNQAVQDFAASLGPLGKPEEFKWTSQRYRGGMTFHGFEVKYPKKTLAIWERAMPDGRIEQFQVLAATRSLQ